MDNPVLKSDKTRKRVRIDDTSCWKHVDDYNKQPKRDWKKMCDNEKKEVKQAIINMKLRKNKINGFEKSTNNVEENDADEDLKMVSKPEDMLNGQLGELKLK